MKYYSKLFLTLVCTGLILSCPIAFGNDEVGGESSSGSSEITSSTENSGSNSSIDNGSMGNDTSNAENDTNTKSEYIELPTIDEESGITNRDSVDANSSYNNDGTDRRGNEVDEGTTDTTDSISTEDGTNRQGNEVTDDASTNSETDSSLSGIEEVLNETDESMTETQTESSNSNSGVYSYSSKKSYKSTNTTSDVSSSYIEPEAQDEPTIRSLILPSDLEEGLYMILSKVSGVSNKQYTSQVKSETNNMQLDSTAGKVLEEDGAANNELVYFAKIALVFSVPALAGLLVGLSRKRKRAKRA